MRLLALCPTTGWNVQLHKIFSGSLYVHGEFYRFFWSAIDDAPAPVLVQLNIANSFHRVDEFECPEFRWILVVVLVVLVVRDARTTTEDPEYLFTDQKKKNTNRR